MYSPLTSITPSGKYKNFSTSSLIATGKGTVVGVVINSHTNGTLKLEDALTDTTPIIFNTITFSQVAVTGERFVPFYGAMFITGLYAVVGGTADLTIIFNQ